MKKINITSILLTIPEDISDNRESGMSGGNRILFESLKNWKGKTEKLEIITCHSGRIMIEQNFDSLDNITIHQICVPKILYKNLFILFLYKTLIGSIYTIAHCCRTKQETIIFSSSDIFPDSIPAFFAKLFNRRVKWVAAFYFFAASPFSKEFPYKGYGAIARGTIYYITQSICYSLIKKFADYVVVCNELDRKRFIREKYPEESICAIYGGADLSEADSVEEPKEKKYEAVYMARFHPQKGPLIAVKVWHEVVKTRKHYKLAMIGNGPEENKVREYIENNNLISNIKLLGFMDGVEKYKVLKSAKVFLHTTIYDTGGMAAAEGMAAGLPVLSFDHEGFDYCYPKGILRVSPIGDHTKMAEKFLELMDDDTIYKRIQSESLDLAQEWDWKKRATFLFNNISSCWED